MPIYEYECKKCGHRFEQLQKVTEKPLSICPKCKKTQLVKLVSNTSFQLKGTGWYITDFKNKNTVDKKTKTSDEPSIKKEDKKDDKKIDAKVSEKSKNVEKK